jgi:hypothetical protein
VITKRAPTLIADHQSLNFKDDRALIFHFSTDVLKCQASQQVLMASQWKEVHLKIALNQPVKILSSHIRS